MYYLFLIKKPIVFLWLIAIYFGFFLIQYSLEHVFSENLYFNFASTFPTWLSAAAVTLTFHRLFLYFYMGHSILNRSHHVSIRGIPLKTFRNEFNKAVAIYVALVFLNIFFSILFGVANCFFFSMSFINIIYEHLLVYFAKWTAIYHLAERGVTLSQHDLQEAFNEVRQLFITNFGKSEKEG